MKKKDSDTNDLESPLGIADEPIARTAGDHLDSDPADARRRRARALGEDGLDGNSTTKPGLGDLNVDPDGAAGTDMGYGGEGTDVSSRRR